MQCPVTITDRLIRTSVLASIQQGLSRCSESAIGRSVDLGMIPNTANQTSTTKDAKEGYIAGASTASSVGAKTVMLARNVFSKCLSGHGSDRW